MAITYKSSGVDVEAGDALVDWLKEGDSRSQPHADRIVSGIGGFASVFRAGFPDMKKPCLVSSTDGVGTKLKLVAKDEHLRGIGQDLVAMCVNDLICTGAQPLFFLDYYATGRLEANRARSFLDGVRESCHKSDCALIGGETAEMPGVYQNQDFDCAGFSVGVVDEEKMLGPHRVQDTDVLIGVESSGFHSNGYSLLRKLFSADLDAYRERLLVPTHLYPAYVLECLRKTEIHAIAHITGGGMDNLPRVLPERLQAQMQPWELPSIFQEAQKRAGISLDEMLRTFNCGWGLILVVPESSKDPIFKISQDHGFGAQKLGQLVLRKEGEPEWTLAGSAR